MTEKELREIRRRFNPEKTNITAVCGCLINDRHEIVARFRQSTGLSETSESERLLAILKRTLSGTIGTNLLDLAFSTAQVENSDEHRLLTALKRSALKDENALEEFYTRVAESVEGEGNHVLLVANDTYDVFTRHRDGEKSEVSESVYSYIIACVCPIKDTKPALTFDAFENSFRTVTGGAVLAAPEYGFLFPTFDNRTENIYNTLFYTRDVTGVGRTLAEQLLHIPFPMPAAEQKENFDTCLSTLSEKAEEPCEFETVRALHSRLSDMVRDYKEEKHEEPMTVNKRVLSEALQADGVDEVHVEAFRKKFEESFGEHSELPPQNILDLKQFCVKTPDVSIKVNPERTDLISTQVIDGTKYILICADEEVEVNGVPVK